MRKAEWSWVGGSDRGQVLLSQLSALQGLPLQVRWAVKDHQREAGWSGPGASGM